MADRLSTLDASFLYLEEPATPLQVGSVMTFSPGAEDFDLDRLQALVTSRIAYVPRYRQRIRTVPGGLSNPVWVDAADFDLSYHVRRAALPRPGSIEQLEEFVARTQARPLDRSRPLWELYLVEGLEDDRFAIVTKTHQALVDGVHAIDLAQVIVDTAAAHGEPLPHSWHATREPSTLELAAQATLDLVRSPGQALRHGVGDAARSLDQARHIAADVAHTVLRSAARPAVSTPLNAEVGVHRRVLLIDTELADYRQVRDRVNAGRPGAQISVHDVILAVVTGGLRNWLLTRGEAVSAGQVLRALVPVSTEGVEDSEDGGPVMPLVAVLPVGEPNPLMRLHQVAYSMHQQMESSQAVTAGALRELAGFAPATLHSLGVRVAGAMSRRMINLVVTNVPGPQQPLFIGDARMSAAYPVLPLAKGQALAIGLTSYDGGVYFGLNADRDVMTDLSVLGQCLTDALDELLEEM